MRFYEDWLDTADCEQARAQTKGMLIQEYTESDGYSEELEEAENEIVDNYLQTDEYKEAYNEEMNNAFKKWAIGR